MNPRVRYSLIVPNQDAPPSIKELRDFLKEKLPDYMVPSSFVFLDTLPLTPNGKVDRQALPAPDETRLELESAFVPPRTPVEEVLAGIWSEVLSVEQLGIYDNFFELGGHSLLATQVLSRVRNTFHVDLPLRSIFENPTVDALAKGVVQRLAEQMGHNETFRILQEVEVLSDEEAQKLLANERASRQ